MSLNWKRLWPFLVLILLFQIMRLISKWIKVTRRAEIFKFVVPVSVRIQCPWTPKYWDRKWYFVFEMQKVIDTMAVFTWFLGIWTTAWRDLLIVLDWDLQFNISMYVTLDKEDLLIIMSIHHFFFVNKASITQLVLIICICSVIWSSCLLFFTTVISITCRYQRLTFLFFSKHII